MSDTTVDVLGSIALGDCRANVPLKWGDLVEIPEIEIEWCCPPRTRRDGKRRWRVIDENAKSNTVRTVVNGGQGAFQESRAAAAHGKASDRVVLKPVSAL